MVTGSFKHNNTKIKWDFHIENICNKGIAYIYYKYKIGFMTYSGTKLVIIEEINPYEDLINKYNAYSNEEISEFLKPSIIKNYQENKEWEFKEGRFK